MFAFTGASIAATVLDPSLFRSGREFAAWLGKTPRQNSSGGKERLDRTSKRGDKVTKVDGRQIEFAVRTSEGTKKIGIRSHSQMVIDVAKFARRFEFAGETTFSEPRSRFLPARLRVPHKWFEPPPNALPSP